MKLLFFMLSLYKVITTSQAIYAFHSRSTTNKQPFKVFFSITANTWRNLRDILNYLTLFSTQGWNLTFWSYCGVKQSLIWEIVWGIPRVQKCYICWSFLVILVIFYPITSANIAQMTWKLQRTENYKAYKLQKL